jgi:CHAT domain-containing protein/tetratricopeptide (TPR) repeat protein
MSGPDPSDQITVHGAHGQVLRAIDALTQAGSWSNAKEVVVQRPELLGDLADQTLRMLVAWEPDPRNRDFLGQLLMVLRRSRAVGVDAAFAPLLQPAPPAGRVAELPPGLEAEAQEMAVAYEEAKRSPLALRRKIDLIERMLARLEPGRYQAFRAAFWSDLGVSYAGLPDGDRGENLGKAIAALREALRSIDPEADPRGYASTLRALGVAYADLPIGDRAGNLREAVACFREALRHCTPEADPRGYARIQSCLGVAYGMRPDGDRGENLQESIAALREALRFIDPEADPRVYASTWHDLGVAYTNLLVGDRARNLQEAITALREAERFLKPESDPLGYASIQYSLGIAYTDLPIGNREENLGQAIACFQEALRFHALETAPHIRALDWNDLGIAYARRAGGTRTEDHERAIACFQEALRIWTPDAAPLDYARAQSNLGAAYTDLPIGDKAESLEKAITAYREALRFWTPEAAPLDHARTQFNLALAYVDRPTGRRAENIRQALAAYRKSLRSCRPETAPDLCREVAYGLGNLHFGERRWDRARVAFTTAIAAAEARYQVAATEASRQAELAPVGNLVANLAYCLARLGKLDEAVERLEAGKARGLAESLARDRAGLDGVQPGDRAAFEAARGRIKELDAEARESGRTGGAARAASRSFAETSDDLRTARHELDAVIQRIRLDQPEFMAPGLDFRAIADAPAPGCPLVYLITTSQGSVAFIVPAGIEALDDDHAVWIDGFRTADLEDFLIRRDGRGEVIGGYLFAQVERDHETLRESLDVAMPILRDRLVRPLALGLEGLGFQRASLVAGGRLSLLPLHAAGFDAIAIGYVPSARALLAARDEAEGRAGLAPVLLGIGNPLPNPRPLDFARIETEEIAPRFAPGSRRMLPERDATRAAVLRSLPGATHLHFSCHGLFDVREPLDSFLSLSGDDRLTLRDFLDGGLDLSSARLAVLSACQTGVVDFNKVPDEAIGFPAGLIQAGVPGVVSTLWPVDAISTAILMGRFYLEHRDYGLDPASALHRAQDWLRTATAQQMGLAERYESLYRASGGRDHDAFVAWRHHRAEPQAKPFAHPFYWAAFTLTGAG